MGIHSRNFKTAVSSTLVLSLLALAGCNKPGNTPTPQTQQPPQQGSAAAPYTPPSAEQLSQMVAPIALFPDKLVGQVLAGATYPEQITAANQWLAQNPSLKGDALQTAEASQPWDVSVKSLTAFPDVLGQMAGNIPWTTALGEAYVNDPNDVMNAIQVLRVRAQQAGTLKTSHHLRVSATPRPVRPPVYVRQSPSEPMFYSGPEVIPPPPETVVIEPAEPDVVYVPHYSPAIAYGEPVPVYPGWRDPQPTYTTGNMVTTGVLAFGAGVLVGTALNHHHHDSNWNAWGVDWGGHRAGREGEVQRPTVVHDNTPYVSKSVTVVNRVNNVSNINNVNNITNNNYRTTNDNRTQNIVVNNAAQRPPEHGSAAPSVTAPAQRQGGPMTMPHFTARSSVPGAPPPPASPAIPVPPATSLPPVKAFAAAPHPAPVTPITPVMPAAQHDQHQPPRTPQELQAANRSMHEQARRDQVPPQAMLDRAHARALREGADTARAPQAPERGSITAHVPPAQHIEAGTPHMPPPQHAAAGAPPAGNAEAAPAHAPAQHAVAATPHAPPAVHAEAGPPHAPAPGSGPAPSPAHPARQEMLAMHNEHPHPAPAKPHEDKHEEGHRQHDKHEKHDGQ